MEITNWSKTGRSPCTVVRPRSVADIREAISRAGTSGRGVIARGAGHSYTDAAWNTNGLVLDLSAMRRILSWDPERGIIQAEPGASLLDVLRITWKDGWWLFATPSTPNVTLGGCAAMNIMGKNSWKCGAFGDHVLAADLLLASGEVVSLTPDRDVELFHAAIGGLGLLGTIVSVTVQLQRLPSPEVVVTRHSATGLADIFALYSRLLEDSARIDFIEAWIDGFATGNQLGRGQVTCASITDVSTSLFEPVSQSSWQRFRGGLETAVVSRAGPLVRPAFHRLVPTANRFRYWRGQSAGTAMQRLSMPAFTYYSPAAFAGYHAVLPGGVETFHAFVSAERAQDTFESVLRYSQQRACFPIWCIIKAHRRDPYLLSYQVDGFSLELNYPRTASTFEQLTEVLKYMIELVIAAGGRFYLAKDHFQTASQYRRSQGDDAIDRFLALKARYDPAGVWQSDLFRRLFRDSASR